MRCRVNACLMALLVAAAPAAADDRYFLLLFASEACPKRAKTCHSFASLVHVHCAENGPNSALTVYTISWLPATLDVHPARWHPEPGVNLGLWQTIHWAQSNGQQVYLWGPYEVRPLMLLRFAERLEGLESGRVLYRAIDSALRDSRIADCIHAISDIDPLDTRIRFPLVFFGVSATHHIAKVFYANAMIRQPVDDVDWILDRLQLTHAGIERRAIPMRPRHDFEGKIRRIDRHPPAPVSRMPTPDLVVPKENEANRAGLGSAGGSVTAPAGISARGTE